MVQETSGTKKNTGNIQAILVRLDYMGRDILDIKTKLEADYVTRPELDPIKKVVYGLVGLILAGVVGGMLTLLIRH